MKIIARSEAMAAGLKKYFTGKPCPRGHISERHVGGGCLQCAKEDQPIKAARLREARRKDPEKYRKINRQWNAANKEKKSAMDREYRAKNKDKVAQSHRVYAQKNMERKREIHRAWVEANREANRAHKQKWAEKNPGAMRERVVRRRASVMKRTPPWFGELDKFVMEQAAELCTLRAAQTGIDWHVDHMIPLRAKDCSGLHVWNNLQVIPEKLNFSKNNSLVFINPGEWIRHA